MSDTSEGHTPEFSAGDIRFIVSLAGQPKREPTPAFLEAREIHRRLFKTSEDKCLELIKDKKANI